MGLKHRLPIRALRNEITRDVGVRAGYEYGRYGAEGEDYDGESHTLEMGFDVEFPAKITFDFVWSYSFQPFDHRSSFPDPSDLAAGIEYGLDPSDRKDQIWHTEAVLEIPIMQIVVGSLRYAYTKSDSNVSVFEFDRHVVGGYLTYAF